MSGCVISGAEDGRADTNHGAAVGNGIGIVAGHTHGQYFHAYIIVFFCLDVNSQSANFFKKFIIIALILANGGDGHQTTHPYIGEVSQMLQQGQNIADGKAGFAGFLTNVNLQQNILPNALTNRLLGYGLQ